MALPQTDRLAQRPAAATVRKTYSSSSSARAAPKPAPPSHRVQAPDLAASLHAAKKKHDESLDDLDCVLFLDVDGVLHSPNPKHARQQFQRTCMEFLKDICNETGCKIVLSTTWRLHAEARDHLANKLAEYGIPQFVSRTPSIAQFQRVRLWLLFNQAKICALPVPRHCRSLIALLPCAPRPILFCLLSRAFRLSVAQPKEILAWVSKHRPKAWVAVDDWPLHEDVRMNGHFVQTRNRYGLQADTAARCCALLKAQQQQPDGGAAPVGEAGSASAAAVAAAASVYGSGATRQ